jgi:aspartyl protease family protein
MTASKANRCGMGLGSLLAWSLALSFPGAAQTPPGVGADILATMDRLAIKLPMDIAASDPVRKPLEELSRERCDQKAIATLGTELDKVGYRREAANAHVSYSETCGGYPPSLRAAAIILLRLTDYPKAATVASDLIKLQPFSDSGYYLRGVASRRFSQEGNRRLHHLHRTFRQQGENWKRSLLCDGAKLREAGPIL